MNGFYQIPLDAKSKELTAFSINNEHYMYNCLPMGARGSPLCFQRLMNNVLSSLLGNGVSVHMDDIIVVSKDLNEYMTKLEHVLHRLGNADLKVKISKCQFFQEVHKVFGPHS